MVVNDVDWTRVDNDVPTEVDDDVSTNDNDVVRELDTNIITITMIIVICRLEPNWTTTSSTGRRSRFSALDVL